MKSFPAIFLLIPFVALGQFEDPNLQAMVDAERAFIKMAREKNTRDAFLYYLSDEAVTAGPHGPVVGKERLKSQQPNESLLSWDIAFSDIASSGDLGYNTGPWEFRVVRADENPSAYGQFHSVWRKQPEGSWRNILDIGIRHPSAATKEILRTTSKPWKATKKTPAVEAIVSLMSQEKAFLEAYRKGALSAYLKVASSEIRFSREGKVPITTAADKAAFLKTASEYHNLKLIDGGISSSGDLGYVYGSADAIVFEDNKQETKRGIYLRIWKKEDGKNWKVVLDVMTYQ